MERKPLFLLLLICLIMSSQAGCTQSTATSLDEVLVETVTPPKTPSPSPTPEQISTSPTESNSLYHSKTMKISLRYPVGWQKSQIEPGSERFSGESGFFHLITLASGGMTIDELARAEADLAVRPFDQNPIIEVFVVGGEEARRITPSSDKIQSDSGDPGWGEILIPLSPPILVDGFLSDYLVLQADLTHLDAIAATFAFNEGDSISVHFPANSETPAAGICGGVDGQIVQVVISPEIMPSPRCLQFRSDQVLSLVNQTGDLLPVKLAWYELLLQPGEERLLNVPVGRYLSPGVHNLLIDGTGSAPELLHTGSSVR